MQRATLTVMISAIVWWHERWLKELYAHTAKIELLLSCDRPISPPLDINFSVVGRTLTKSFLFCGPFSSFQSQNRNWHRSRLPGGQVCCFLLSVIQVELWYKHKHHISRSQALRRSLACAIRTSRKASLGSLKLDYCFFLLFFLIQWTPPCLK